MNVFCQYYAYKKRWGSDNNFLLCDFHYLQECSLLGDMTVKLYIHACGMHARELTAIL